VTLLSGVMALWNYHLASISVQMCNKDNTSALCVCWRIAHRVNDPTLGKTGASSFRTKMKLSFTEMSMPQVLFQC